MEHGQATLEYTLIVVVLAVGLVLGGAVAAGEGARVTDAVGAGVRRGLCVVLGGDCFARGGPRSCVVATDGHSRELAGQLLVFRLGDGRAVLREHRADGSVVVSVVQGQRFGAALTVGGVMTVNGKGLRTGAEVGADGRGAYTRTWTVPNARAADRLVARLAAQDAPVAGVTVLAARLATDRGEPGPAPDSRAVDLGGGAHGSAVLRAMGLGAQAELLGAATAGGRVDRHGVRTVVLRQEGELTAALTAPLGALAGGLPARSAIELAFARDGTPVELTLRALRGVHGRAKLGPYDARGGSQLELEARLDLTDPTTRALASRLVAGLRSADADGLAAARALAARLAEHARVDLRLLDTDRREKTDGVRLPVGGGEVVTVDESARLVAAVGREPGLGWRRRLDCGVVA